MTAQPLRRIPYTKPSITDLEVQYATDAARNGWGEHCYDYIIRFEEAFKAHLGVKYAIATSSCTGALHMGMHALGIGSGDEVILADTNWIATAAPIVHLGANPVFVDILPDSWCLDPEQVEEAITPKTKAIIAVHLYGNLCDMNALLAIGERHGIPVIEDAAEAIGSIYHGQRAGSMGRFGAFSFHGTKTITTGEGGMFVTNDPELYEQVLTLSNHGRARNQTKQFWPDVVGFKYKMSNIQAAIGCAQIERVNELIKEKQDILERYKKKFKEFQIGNYCFNKREENCEIGAWMTNVVIGHPSLNSMISESLQEHLKPLGIDVRPFFYPLSSVQPFQHLKPQNPTQWWSYKIPPSAINLPCAHGILSQEIDRITSCIASVVN
ncbi:DegT/DnrJ/EryC1/StrS family aminotransferase [Synechococcus elongatus]|uniref:DegT/DnrJ/EryC1/StrS family aminotransferase n=1 Tax=Synechococcus elongatus PCC 11801 TaxID=2219813 RepID=A0AAN1QLJ7_SYNEL|nr:DegT/DnrJ/EryC1/StrS family aminotransferase [Synechococcus elongatus]AZB71587.1 glutamine--scyllo-inositol aminotransferase [Synechococcus elongatus PCC 11801]